MLLAAIDIGTNAVRLFFSNVFLSNGTILSEKASLVRIPIRLGEDVFSTQHISEEKINRLVKTMQAFRLLIDVCQPVAWKACATSAMREAVNQEEVIKRVASETGIQIEVIDGLEEASLVSAFQNHAFPDGKKYRLFIDVGGGSTELSLMKETEAVASASFRIGTVRLLQDKVKKKEWTAMGRWLKSLKLHGDKLLLVGSGGNINKLNKLYGNVAEFTLSAQQLSFAMKDLSSYTLEERIWQLGLRPDRADVILPAGEIFGFIMKHTRADVIYVPKIGLSDGMVHTMYKEQLALSLS